jgi:hypothetical protein
MQTISGLVLLAVGLVLLVWGVNASESFSSDISRLFTGSVTNKSIYLIVGGALVLIVGSSIAYGGRRKAA